MVRVIFPPKPGPLRGLLTTQTRRKATRVETSTITRANARLCVVDPPSIWFSMDGCDQCMDNTSIEQLWRSLKDEETYLYEIADGFTARRPIRRSWRFRQNARD